MKRRYLIRVVALNIAVWALALVWALPFVGILMISVMPYQEVITKGWLRIPSLDTLTLKNYIEALTNPLYDLATGFRNSVVVATVSTLIPLFAAALAAYAFANLDFRLKPLLFALIIALMMIPQQLIVVPLFFLYRSLGIYDTLQGMILLHSAWGIAWATFFLRNYLKFIPRSLIEAARVDGASDFKIFRRVVMPLAVPGLIAAAVLQFTWVWNDLFYALVSYNFV